MHRLFLFSQHRFDSQQGRRPRLRPEAAAKVPDRSIDVRPAAQPARMALS